MRDSRTDFPIVGIGATAGALDLLRALLAGRPESSDMALLVALPPDAGPQADPSLAAQLRSAGSGERIEAGQVYRVPPGHGVGLVDGRLALIALDGAAQAPIDTLLASLGAAAGGRAAGVLLSVTGEDGSHGLRALKENGGFAVAQAGLEGTPLLAALADLVLPAGEILPALARCHTAATAAETPTPGQIAALCREVQAVTGHDISGHATERLQRAIARRMALRGLTGAGAYLDRARADPAESEALLRDLLVNATRFFRDPGAFEALRLAIEPLIREGEAIRVWVPGCSSGEEAYSLALLMRDAMERLGRFPRVSITATDIEPQLLALARAARYPRAALAEIPEPLRARFTRIDGDHFTFAPEIRDMLRFFRHCVIADPSPSDLDLVSCRNLLGQFDPALQRRLLQRLHAALKPGGLLQLGAGESVEGIEGIEAPFTGLDPDHRLFRRGPALAEPAGETAQAAGLTDLLAAPPLATITVDADLSIRHQSTAPPLSPVARLADLPAPLSQAQDLVRQVARGGAPVTTRLHDPIGGREIALHILPAQGPDGQRDGATLIASDLTPALAEARQLAADRARLRLAVEVAQMGIWDYDPATGTVELDQAECALFDLNPPGAHDSRQVLALLHPEDRARVTAALQAVSAEAPAFDETFRLCTGDGQPRWLRGLGRYTRQGSAPRVLGVSFDVSAERGLLEERALHLAEVNHRIKNLFALVSAMISSVERETEDTRAFSRNLRGRISALDRAHALMRRDDMRAPIPLDQLIEQVLEPSRGGQDIRVEGPETLVPVRELTPLVLILHEWTTNSAKYGALSVQDGALAIRWSDGAAGLVLDWRETAQESAEPGSGFGSRLVQASILQLRAELQREAEGGCLHYRLTLPPFAPAPVPEG